VTDNIALAGLPPDAEGTHRLCVGMWRSFDEIVLDVTAEERKTGLSSIANPEQLQF